MPFKTFTTGELVTAADANTYWSEQAIATFPTAAERDIGIASPVDGQHCYLITPRVMQVFVAGQWRVTGGATAVANVSLAAPSSVPGATGTATITWPVGVFTATPNVQATPISTNSTPILVQWQGGGTESVTINGWQVSGSPTQRSVDVLAVQGLDQGTPAAAAQTDIPSGTPLAVTCVTPGCRNAGHEITVDYPGEGPVVCGPCGTVLTTG